jgi:hypothetical protein
MLFSKEKNSKMEEIREFISVSASSSFDSFSPHILNAERDYLIPVIGTDLYDEITETFAALPFDSPTEPQLKQLELLRICRSAIIHISVWIGFDLLNAHISEGGFKRTESASVKPLFKYQEDHLKAYFRTNGFNALDSILTYLESNSTVFTSFFESTQGTIFKSSFIPNTGTFDDILFINKSRLTFLRLKAQMQLTEVMEIAPILGIETFNYIKSELVKDKPADKVIALLPYIRRPLAYLSSALLMEESGADLTDNGLYFTSVTASYNNDTAHDPSSSERIAILVKRNRNFGYAYLDQLRTYLLSNPADWTLIVPSTGKVLRRDNTNKKTFWA